MSKIKLFVSASLVALLLGVVQGVPAMAAEVSMPADLVAGPGTDIVIPITVDPADGVLSLDLAYLYDPAVLQPLGVYKTEASDAYQLTYDAGISGLLDISLFHAQALMSGRVEVAWVLFHVVGAAGTSSTLGWTEYMLNEDLIPSDPIDGFVQIATEDAVMSVPDDMTGVPGSSVAVPIDVTAVADMVSVDIELRYNPLVITAVSVQKTSLTQTMTLIPNLLNGKVLIALFTTTPISGSGALVNVTFDVVGSIGDETPLDLRVGEVNEGGITTVLDDGFFRICDDTDADQDGVTECDGDCDDGNADVYPDAPEICDGVDNQCPGDGGYGEIDEGGDALCDNGDYCDGDETCGGASGCQAGIPVDCSVYADECIDAWCDENIDQCVTAQKPDDTPCEDGDLCTDPDTCQAGVCVSGDPVVCADANECTEELCDPGTGCYYPFLEGDVCDGGIDCGQCWVGICETRSGLPAWIEFVGGEGGILDIDGEDTGFTHMIPSTGGGYLPENLDVASGILTVTTNEGDFARRSNGTQNTQDNPLALPIDTTGTAPFQLSARLVAPWNLEDDYQSGGVLYGIDEDNYVKLVVFHNSSRFGGAPNDDPDHTGFQVGIERVGSPGVIEENNYAYPAPDGFLSVSSMDLYLEVDPVAATLTACYRADEGDFVTLETDLPINPSAGVELFTECSYAAIIQTNNDFSTATPGGDPLNSPWDPNYDWFAVTLADADGDGLTACEGDCDDSDPDVYPGAPEICDGIDNQCPGDPGHGEVDEGGDTLCDDTLFCSGEETCDGANGCLAGTDPCDDLVGCTADTCDDDTDTCGNLPDHGLCDDLDACTEDTCDPLLDCQIVDTTPEGQCCDAATGVLTPIDDEVGCTLDVCNEDGSVTHTPDHGACDDGQWCNGGEWCDAVNDCQAGTAPVCDDSVDCTVDSCNEDTDACDYIPDDGACDDGNECTADVCDPLADCGYPPLEGDVCDGGVLCGQCWSAVCQTQSGVPLALEFDGFEGGILDGDGEDTGFTHRVPTTSGGYLPENLDVASGILTVTTTEGDFARRSNGIQNTQDNPLTMTVDASGAARLSLHARLVAPWDLEDDYQSAGVFFGADEDNYVKFVVFHNSSAFGGTANDDPDHTGFQVGIERTSGPGSVEEHNDAFPAVDGFQSVTTMDLFMEVDPVTATVTACYRADDGALVVVETDLVINPDPTADLFTECSYAGITHTSNDYATPAPGDDPNNSPWHPHFERFTTGIADADGDGLTICEGDCDDGDPDVYPGAPEICDGVDNQCPGDAGHGQIDEGGGALCDDFVECTQNVCDGAAGCSNPPEAAGTSCGSSSDTDCDNPDTCDGLGACQDNYEPVTTECRTSAGNCDVSEYCAGSAPDCPADGYLPDTTECRASAGDCDLPETCTGAGAVCPADLKSTAECRGSAGDCDVAEVCDGSSDACPADGYLPDTTECRASTGDCDLPETCTGGDATCPADLKSTAECRASGGDCDVAEVCDGSSDACPADGYLPDTTECRASAGDCDLPETCTGAGAVCPADLKSTAECRGSAGDCDVAEVCDGSSDACPADGYLPDTTECRASAGDCDLPETCTGGDATCPADLKSTAECRASGGDCDVAEVCDGSSDACPADGYLPDTTECRASAGDCDLPETCTGAGAVCPADLKSTAECRGSAGDCDVAEVCDGSSDACPADGYLPDTTECRASAGDCDLPETCTGGDATCPADLKSTAECRASGGDCDVAEVCDGSSDACPADGYLPDTTECRASAGDCDLPETCTGAGAVCPADLKSTAECRGSAGDCDVAEVCDGSSDACPADGYLPDTTECRASAGDCDLPETCTGTGAVCPADLKSTAECRGSAGDCDVAEVCDGSSDACPADGYLPDTTECRASAGDCDLPETCTGTGAVCPADLKSTAECRGSAGDCDVAEVCDGSSDACPADAYQPNGTGCDDDSYCNVGETCTDGTCGGGAARDCGDAVGCTVDTCDDVGDACINTPSDALCDDTNACTSDSCDEVNDCQFTPVDIDDDVGCTDDACDPATGDISHTPNHGLCDDTVFCNGSETCDELNDCQPGTPPTCDDEVSCTDDFCDVDADSCANSDTCPGDQFCDGLSDICTTTVELPDIDVCPGADLFVPVVVDAIDDLNDLDLTFSYDPLVLDPVAVLQAPLTAGFTMSSDTTVPGVIDIALSSATPVAGGGTVAWVQFSVISPVGDSTALQWTGSLLDGGEVGSVEVDGQVDVVAAQTSLSLQDDAAGTPGGTVIVPLEATPADGVGLDITIEFDQTVIQFVNATTTAISSGHTLVFNLRAPGQLDISLFGVAPLVGSGPIVDIEFLVVGLSGDLTPLILTRGQIDEGGVTTCLDDGVLRVCGSVAADDLTCDDVDDDCNGLIDDGYVPTVSICGVGECSGNTGLLTCVDGSTVDTCDPFEGAVDDDQCDGLDNDCDGTADDDYAPIPTGCGVGQCAGNVGLLTCVDGSTIDTCDPFDGATEEICDGADNDCNDVVDDGPSAGDIGNEMRFGPDPTVMTWADLPNANVYNVYRGSIVPGLSFVYDHTCYEAESPDARSEDTSDPPDGHVRYYLVSAVNSCQGEDTLGTDSAGTPRPNDDPCPEQGFDSDSDGIIDLEDNCPLVDNPGQTDQDVDGVGDDCDNCPATAPGDQRDRDGDGVGNICDTCTDTDGDGFGDPGFPQNTCELDNCPDIPNPAQDDTDGDGFGDICEVCINDSDNDIDHDGVCGDVDLCPLDYDPDQEDYDLDGIGDVCDDCADTDGDGFGDPGFPDDTCALDNCPSDDNPGQQDPDGDLIGSVCDICPDDFDPDQFDSDDDGQGDACDACPANPDPACVECPAGTDPDGDGFCSEEIVFVEELSVMRYLANSVDPGGGLDWIAPDFEYQAWLWGVYGVGYETGTGAEGLISTAVPPGSLSVYTRSTFGVADPASIVRLEIGADYDDGYVAWVNGTEVHRAPQMPAGDPAWDTPSAGHESSGGSDPDYGTPVNVTEVGVPALASGDNLLAIGVWNTHAGSSDLVLVPRLRAVTGDNCPEVPNPGQEDADEDGYGDDCDP